MISRNFCEELAQANCLVGCGATGEGSAPLRKEVRRLPRRWWAVQDLNL